MGANGNIRTLDSNKDDPSVVPYDWGASITSPQP